MPKGSWEKYHTQGSLPGAARGPRAAGLRPEGCSRQGPEGMVFFPGARGQGRDFVIINWQEGFFQFKFSRSCLFATHVILIVLNLRIPWLQYNATHVILIVLNLRIPWPAHVILIVLNPRIPWPAHGILRFSTIKITWIAWYPG